MGAIGILWHAQYPWDVRIEKIAETLVESGEKVYLLSKGKEGLASYEEKGKVGIARVNARRLSRIGGGWAL